MSSGKPLTDKECIQINQGIFSLRNIYESRMRNENDDTEGKPGIAEIGALMVIGQSDNITAQGLSHLMDLTRGTISIYVKRLVSLGLVTQTRSVVDKRLWHIALTKKGAETYASAYRWTVSYTKDIIAVLNQAEQKALHDLLLKVAHGNGYDWQ